jgi:uncharacterized LabA/DUF88 family protein
MQIFPLERLALFIDGANLHATARALDFDIDFKRLLTLFRDRGNLIRAIYYTTIVEDAEEFSSLRPLVDWLDYNGFTTVTKVARQFAEADGRRMRSKIDVDLAVDAMRLQAGLDHLFIFSGNGDFTSLVATLQDLGKRVSVVSTLSTVADELRRQADQFIDLLDIKDHILRLERPIAQNRKPK